MQLKYRAYIDGEFYCFDLLELIEMAEVDAVACTLGKNQPNKKILKWLNKGNQPDVFTGCRDNKGIDIYENDIILLDGEIITPIKYYGNEDYPAFDTLVSVSDSNNIAHALIDLDGSIKIIGTTHQNKELLK
jgi:hypothetical protein